MDLQTCTDEAQKVADRDRITIAIVDDPIGNAEDEAGPYGYCPPHAVPYIHKHGTVVKTLHPQ